MQANHEIQAGRKLMNRAIDFKWVLYNRIMLECFILWNSLTAIALLIGPIGQ
jgi:hypothetical protein